MDNDKLNKLKEQRKALDARIRQEQNRKNTKQRTQDTRRKILAGAAVLSEAGKDVGYKTALYDLLARFLTKPEDRALFGLPAASETKSQKPEQPENAIKTQA